MKYPTQRTNTSRLLGLAHTAHRGEFQTSRLANTRFLRFLPQSTTKKTQEAVIKNIFKEKERSTLNCVSAILRPVQSTNE